MKYAISIIIAILLTLPIAGCKKPPEREAPTGGGASSTLLKYEKEARLLNEILKEDPTNMSALIRLGNLSMDANRFSEAVDAYERALEIDPKNANVRVDMGTCYRRLGRPEKAVEEYKAALTYAPNHYNAYANMGVVLAYDLGRTAEAIESFEKALQINPTAPNAQALRQEIERLRASGKQVSP